MLEVQGCAFCTIIWQPVTSILLFFFYLIISIISFKLHLGKIRNTLGDHLMLLYRYTNGNILSWNHFKEGIVWGVGLIDPKLNLLHTFGKNMHKIIRIHNKKHFFSKMNVKKLRLFCIIKLIYIHFWDFGKQNGKN